jgi:hypothetical protein
MAITSLLDGISNVGPTGDFLIGPNTIAPYAGTSVVGLTDGTSPATASKNVAEIYNELLFDKRIIIEKSGLTFDAADNSQLLRAIQKTANYSQQSYGTFASVLAPTVAPSEANPQNILTNTNGEVFMWNGTAWVYIGGGPNGFEGTLQATQYPMLAFTANTQILESAIVTITNPSSTRAMKVIFSETNVWLSYIQSVGNVTVDFIVEVHAVGAGVVYGTYNGRAIGAPNFPAGSEQSIAQVGILPFGASWIVAASSAQQFKITLRSSNNNGGVVTPAAGVVPVIHLSGKYKTEFLN